MISKRALLLSGAILLSALFGASREAAAATIIVDDDGVQCPTATFNTIQAAVNAAADNDTIQVCAGTYAEGVTVNKILTIHGARSGVDARDASRTAATPPTTESVVTGVGNNGITPFNITANGVVIDGFTIEGASNGNQFGFAILIGAGTSGTQILNNVIQNNIAAISLANNSSTSQTLIRRNLIRDNNVAGPVSGTGIYTDQFNAGGALTNVLIDDNTFSNDQNVAVLLGSTQAGSQTAITVSNNIMDGDGNAVLAFNLSSSTVRRNTIQNSAGSQIAIGGGVTGLSITENFIQNGTTNGIRIGDFGGGSPNSGVSAVCNSISGNAVSGINNNESPNYTGTLDARFTWWGSPTGPTIASNPGGTGDAIIDPDNEVIYQPFLTSGADASPTTPGFQCNAPAPGQVLISEFRTQGTTATDEFIELYNATTASLDLINFVVEVEGGTPLNIPVAIIPARGHFLLAHQTGYTLTTYAAADQTYNVDEPANAGLRLADSTGTTIDAVGFTTSSTAFKEGTGLATVGTLGQFSHTRTQVGTGVPHDTDNNAADFALVAPDPATVSGANLGAPGPENAQSPVNRGAQIKSQLFGPCFGSSDAPNRERNSTPYTDTLTPSSPSGTGDAYASGTLRLRRRFTNNTGQDVTQLRFRVVDITAGAPGGGTADVRLLTSGNEATVANPCPTGGTSTNGLALEQPPTQAKGGGLNSTVAQGTITTGTPLAAGASIDLNFLLGVQATGSFRFFVIVEALPTPPPAAPALSTGAATNFNGGKGGATPRLNSGAGKGSTSGKRAPLFKQN